MRVRRLCASLGVLALVVGSVLIPSSLANAAPPDGVSVTGTGGIVTVDYPRILLQGTWTVPGGSPAVTSVQVRHSMDPLFGTSTVWCNANVNPLGGWTCSAAVGGMLEHGVNYFQATATNADGQLTSATFSSAATTFDRTPTVSSPSNGSLTNQNLLTVSGAAYPLAPLEIRASGLTLCTPTASGAGAWTCNADISTLGEGAHVLEVEDLTGPHVNNSVSFTIDRIAPAAPVITSPAAPLTTIDGNQSIDGTGEAGASVQVTVDGAPGCSTTADGVGNWSCVVALGPGSASHQISATQTDAATNVSPAATPVTITVVADTTITAPVTNASLANPLPLVVGTAEPGSNVTVQFWGPVSTTCAAVADPSGDFQCASGTFLAPGGYQVIAENTDLGISSPPTTVNIVDSTPTITAPMSGSTTLDARPTISGSYLGDDVSTVMVLRSSDGGVSYSVYCSDTAPTGTFSCASTTDIGLGAHLFAAETYVGPNLIASGPTSALTRLAPPVPPTPPTPPAPTVPPAPPTPPAPVSWSFSLDRIGPVGPGSTVTITASGLPAGSAVTVELHSTPRTLGTTAVGSDGGLRYTALIPTDTEPGDHSLVLTLTPPGGVPSTAAQPVTVEPPAPASPAEPEPVGEPDPSGEVDGETQDAGTSPHPFRGPLPDLPRTDPAAPTSLTESVPTAMEVVLSPVSVLTAGGMALALLILVALPTEILNTTISANSRRFGRAFTWFDDTTTRVSEWLAATFRTSAVPAVLLVALTAIVFSFSDPAVGFDLASLRLFASLGIALFIVTWVASRISEVILERRFGVQSNLLLNPAALVFAVIGVVVARLLDFSPGFLVGLVIGLELAANLAERSRIRAIVVQYGVILALSITAWLGYSLMVLLQADGPSGWITAFTHDTLVAVTAEGLTAIAVGLLPLGFLDGKEVFDYSKRLWAALFVIVGTAFALLVLPNELNGVEVSDYGLWAIVLLGYAAATLLVWLVLTLTAKHDDDATIEHRRVGN